MKQYTPIKVLIFSALSLASFSTFAMENNGSNNSGKDITEKKKSQMEILLPTSEEKLEPLKLKEGLDKKRTIGKTILHTAILVRSVENVGQSPLDIAIMMNSRDGNEMLHVLLDNLTKKDPDSLVKFLNEKNVSLDKKHTLHTQIHLMLAIKLFNKINYSTK